MMSNVDQAREDRRFWDLVAVWGMAIAGSILALAMGRNGWMNLFNTVGSYIVAIDIGRSNNVLPSWVKTVWRIITWYFVAHGLLWAVFYLVVWIMEIMEIMA